MSSTPAHPFLLAGLAGALLLFGGSASASLVSSAGSLAGANASGSAGGSFIVGCTTCPHGDIAMSGTPTQNAGGSGAATAALSYAGQGLSQTLTADGVAGGASYAAWAGFEGGLATPLAKSRASVDNADVERVTPGGPLFVGIDSYQSFATGTAIQHYTYLGSQSASYTFELRFDGTLFGEFASLGAHAAIYAGDDPLLEVALASDGAFLSGNFDTLSSIDQLLNLQITLDPGQSIYLKTSSSAGVIAGYSSEDGWADAYNTLRLTGIQGDASLLQARLPGTGNPTTLPLPPSLALLLPALLALGLGRRLQRQS